MNRKQNIRGAGNLDVMRFPLRAPALIEASAGTGKTYTITNLVLRLLLGSGTESTALRRPLRIEEMLIVTFTNAATADLRRRIQERIHKALMLFERVFDQIRYEASRKAKASKLTLELQEECPDADAFCERFFRLAGEDEKLFNETLLHASLDFENIAEFKNTDPVLQRLLREMVQRGLLKQSIEILSAAERNIDSASIFTIHGFCNNTLNQIYALEAGEAFANGIVRDINEETDIALRTVWRRVFYQSRMDTETLRLILGSKNPDTNITGSVLNELRKRRVSSGNVKDFMGYALVNFDAGVFRRGDITDLKTYAEKTMTLMRLLSLCFKASMLLRMKEAIPDKERMLRAGELAVSLADGAATEDKDDFRRLGEMILDCAGAELDAEQTRLIGEYCSLCGGFMQRDCSYDLGSAVKKAIELLLSLRDKARLNDAFFRQRPDFFNGFGDLFAMSGGSFEGLESAVAASQTDAQTGEDLVRLVSGAADLRVTLVKASAFVRDRVQAVLALLTDRQLEEQLEEQHLMDNDEILLRLDRALHRKEFGEHLAGLIRKRYSVAMIDEFQDTDPVQYSIFSGIYMNEDAVKDDAYCYLIGDPKQSIYAFRNSDINSYMRARESIIRLNRGIRERTGRDTGSGIHRLTDNYRSSPRLVDACNVLFTLHSEPFMEDRIRYEPVNAGIRLETDLSQYALCDMSEKALEAFGAGSDFYIENFDGEKYLGFSSDEQSAYDPLSCTYVISAERQELEAGGYQLTSKTRQAEMNAAMNAALIKKVLSDGLIRDRKAKRIRRVRPDDIAVLVHKGEESRIVQKALNDIGLSGVYFSDRESVLYDGKAHGDRKKSERARNILYLMEAMCNPSSRSAVLRLLSCSLMGLSGEEFRKITEVNEFEKEVRILMDSAAVWRAHGFLPAFEHWCTAGGHDISGRMLETVNGERCMTDYNHICELFQAEHMQRESIQSQMLHYKDILNNPARSFQDDETKKRLESEYNKIKIYTYHSSKGLEFPLVFTPMIWSVRRKGTVAPAAGSTDAVVHYDKDTEAYVLDYGEGAVRSEEITRDIVLDELRERMRLVYVVLTRAAVVNFIFALGFISRRDMLGTSLVQLIAGESVVGCDSAAFMDLVRRHGGLFTPVNAVRCLKSFEAMADRLRSEAEHNAATRAFAERGADAAEDMRYMMSVMYKGAVDDTFNTVSYTSITEGHSELTFDEGVTEGGEREASEQKETGVDDSISALGILPEELDVLGPMRQQAMERSLMPLTEKLAACEVSASAYMQAARESGCLMSGGRLLRFYSLAPLFPKGKAPGVFLHEVLRRIRFEEWQTLSDRRPLISGIVNALSMRGEMLNVIQKAGLMYKSRKDSDSETLRKQTQGLNNWLADIMDAPLVRGRDRMLALSDLRRGDYSCEMNFLMSDHRFGTRELNELCKEMAADILPQDMHRMIGELSLRHSDVEGFITGSIDLACRFDMNGGADLPFRRDLMENMPDLQRRVLEQRRAETRPDEGSATGDRESDYRYFVIDYKSNALGLDASDYTERNMLRAIYEHRYDVQFLIYTLALYRLLKRRMGVDAGASQNELRRFYDDNIGGVLYLFLRGMTADYTRRKSTSGVFSLKIDFDYVQRADRLIGVQEQA